MSALALTFNDTQFDVIDRNQQPWLRGTQIGDALGYKKAGRISIDKLYKANADEFTDSMTALVELDTNGGKQQVRIFSLRGCHLLAMFARTAVAKEFRKWVLDVLEKHTQPRYGLLDLPEPPTITKSQAGELFNQVNAICSGSGKIRAELWSRFQNHFKLASYKDLPAEQFDEALAYLDQKRQEYLGGPVQMFYLSNRELQAKIEQAIKAHDGELLPPTPAEDQMVLPLYQNGNIKRMTVKLDHVHVEGDYQSDRWFVARSDDQLTVQRLDPNALVMTFAEFCAHAREYGYIVVKKTEVAAKLMA